LIRTRRRSALVVVLLLLLPAAPPGSAVRAQTPPPPAQQAPPARQRVVALEVRGNHRIPTEQILAAVARTKVGEPLSEDALREDIRAINVLGFFADVTVRTVTEPDGVRVIFVVTENPLVAEVVIEGATVIPVEELRTALNIPAGQVLNIGRLREGTRAVQKLYEDRGYVLARVADTAIVPLEGAPDQARLRLRVTEGTIEEVRFSGLRRTRPGTAFRFVRETAKGRVFNVNALNRDLQRLFDTGLFESIRARPEPGTEPDTAVIIIEVTEARTAQIGGGVGYSTTEGVLGFVEYRDRNWRGLGQTFAATLERTIQVEQTRTNYELTFTEPYLDTLGTVLTLSLFTRSAVNYEFDDAGDLFSRFDLVRSGSAVTVTRPLDALTTGVLRFKSELTDITPLPRDTTCDPTDLVTCTVAPTFLAQSEGRVVSLALTATRDARNDRLKPTRGYRAQLGTEFALTPLGSDFGFTKYTAEYQQFFPAWRESTFVARLFVGAGSGTLPYQDQFVLGGPSTVRAYRAGRFRGDSIVVATLEYRFSLGTIFRPLGELQGIIFVDAGNAPLSFANPKTGYGFGVAISTPVGPIRVDLAFGPEGRQTWVSLGAPF